MVFVCFPACTPYDTAWFLPLMLDILFSEKPFMFRLLVSSVLIAIPLTLPAQWTPVTAGIDYQQFAATGPNDVYVARMDRSNTDITLESCFSRGKLESGTETVSGMVSRYDDTLGYWGQTWGAFENDAKVAINGDFWDTTNGWPESGQVAQGWYAKRFTNFTGGSGLAWTLNRGVFLGGCVNHTASKQKVTYPNTSQDQNINAINEDRGSGELVLYTPHWDDSTGTDNSGVEVLVELARPALILPTPSFAAGTVVAVYNGQGDTGILFDHVVLSATGSAANKLLANAPVGAEIRISQEITNYEPDCSTSRPGDWTKTYAAIGGNFIFLEDSVIDPHNDNVGATTRNPRTAIAFNDDYIYFIVVDGRRTGSVGMSMQELGNFCLNTLGATNGINQDGGGSSAMWVNGSIVNVPSDGNERPTYNGMMMVSLVPTTTSSAYSAGVEVQTTGAASYRLGPADVRGDTGAFPSGTALSIVDHNLNGVSAKGDHWWYVTDGSATVWVAESDLELAPTAAGHWWVVK